MDVIRDTAPGAGIGLAFGQGLGAGLQALAEHKMQTAMTRRQQNQKKEGLKALGMFDDAQVEGLSKLPDSLLSDVLKGVYKNQYQANPGQPGQEGQQDTSQSDYLLGNPQRPQQSMQQQISSGQQQTQVPGQPTIEQTIASGQRPIEPQLPKGLELLTKGKGLSQTPDLMTNKGAQDVIAATKRQMPVKSKSNKLTVQDLQQLKAEPEKAADVNAGQGQQVKAPATRQENIARTAPSAKTLKDAWSSESGKYVNEIHRKADSAERQNLRLERMAELDARGDIMNPFWATVIQKFGLEDAKFLKSKDTQEMEKLTAEFIKEAKPYFGAKVTNDEIKFYLKTIPTLYMTKEGREAVSRDIKIINNAVEKERDIVDRIIAENGNVPPYNLASRVRKEVEPYMNEVKKVFTDVGGKKGGNTYEVGRIYKNKSGKRAKWDGSKMVPVEG